MEARSIKLSPACFVFLGCLWGASLAESLGATPTTWAQIGRQVFFDTSLSEPRGQGCVSCHQPKAGFADPRQVSPGAVKGRQGLRNAPTLMYAALIPSLRLEDTYDEQGEVEYLVEGGFFRDGRSQNIFEQIRVPFFEPQEMNLKDDAALAHKLRNAAYKKELEGFVGEEVWQDDSRLNNSVYRALVEFLREPVFRPFDAPIDDYWAGQTEALSLAQRRGLKVFENEGKCANCHWTSISEWPKPLLTDSGYDNVGAPGVGQRDPGLGGVTGLKEELGFFKVPTLRNIALTAPYFHNGSIKSLREVIEFYNQRDVEQGRWEPPHYPGTMNREDLGDLKLTQQQVDDLVALMEAFTDRSLLNLQEGDLLPKVSSAIPATEQSRAFFMDPPDPIDVSSPRRPSNRVAK